MNLLIKLTLSLNDTFSVLILIFKMILFLKQNILVFTSLLLTTSLTIKPLNLFFLIQRILNISECISKAYQRMDLIRYSFTVIHSCCCNLTGPLLAFGERDSQELEVLQRRATKLVKTSKDMTINLPSLVHRRKRADLLLMYRIVKTIF